MLTFSKLVKLSRLGYIKAMKTNIIKVIMGSTLQKQSCPYTVFSLHTITCAAPWQSGRQSHTCFYTCGHRCCTGMDSRSHGSPCGWCTECCLGRRCHNAGSDAECADPVVEQTGLGLVYWGDCWRRLVCSCAHCVRYRVLLQGCSCCGEAPVALGWLERRRRHESCWQWLLQEPWLGEAAGWERAFHPPLILLLGTSEAVSGPGTLTGGWPTGLPVWTAGSRGFPSPRHDDGDFDWWTEDPRQPQSDYHSPPGAGVVAHVRSHLRCQACAPPWKVDWSWWEGGGRIPTSWPSSVKHSASSCGKVSERPSWATVCGVCGDGVTSCCDHCSGRSTAHICKASHLCVIACVPPGGVHRLRQMGRGGTCVASLLC